MHSVWFQTARGGPSVFCINLTILFPPLHEIVHGAPLPDSPSLLNSVPLASTRVGWSAGEDRENWFVLAREGEDADLGDEVRSRLEVELAWFDRWPTVDSLLACYDAGPPFEQGSGLAPANHVQHAVLLAYRGRTDLALQMLREEAARANDPNAYSEIEERLRAPRC